MSPESFLSPPAGVQDKLSWYALRFERWQELGERVGLSPSLLEEVSGALGSAAVAFVDHQDRPGPEGEGKLAEAVEELDQTGAIALLAIRTHAVKNPSPGEVLRWAMLAPEPGADAASSE